MPTNYPAVATANAEPACPDTISSTINDMHRAVDALADRIDNLIVALGSVAVSNSAPLDPHASPPCNVVHINPPAIDEMCTLVRRVEAQTEAISRLLNSLRV